MNSIISIGFSSDNGAMCTNFMTVTQPQQLWRWISRIRGADEPDEELELPAQPHIFNHYPARLCDGTNMRGWARCKP